MQRNLFGNPRFWLTVTVVLALAANLVWLRLDRRPPAWDQAAHLRLATLVGQKFSGQTGLTWLQIIREGYGYPPLIYFAGGGWSLVFGIENLTAMMTAVYGLYIFGVYLLAKEILKSDWQATVTAAVMALMPAIADISRSFLLDLPLLTLVTYGLLVYKKSEFLKDFKWSVWWGIILALAALTKLNGFVYFMPMALWSFYLCLRHRSEKIFLNLVTAGLIMAVGVGWWWVVNLTNIRLYLTGLAGQGEQLTDPMNLGNWVTWIHYIRLFFWTQATPLAAVIILGMLLGARLEPWGWVFLAMNYLIFTVIKNKDYRFTLPLLPMAVIGAMGAIRSRAGQWAAIILLTYLGWYFVNNSFNWPVAKEKLWHADTLIMGSGEILNISDYPVRAPIRQTWPNRNIVRDVLARAQGQGKQKLLMLIDTEQLNDNDLKYYREILTAKGDSLLEQHSVYDINFSGYSDFNLVLVGDKDAAPAPFYATNLGALTAARDFVWNHPEQFTKLDEYDLPVGGKAYLMAVNK